MLKNAEVAGSATVGFPASTLIDCAAYIIDEFCGKLALRKFRICHTSSQETLLALGQGGDPEPCKWVCFVTSFFV